MSGRGVEINYLAPMKSINLLLGLIFRSYIVEPFYQLCAGRSMFHGVCISVRYKADAYHPVFISFGLMGVSETQTYPGRFFFSFNYVLHWSSSEART